MKVKGVLIPKVKYLKQAIEAERNLLKYASKK